MSIFNEFPYTNFHELNLDWLIKEVKELKKHEDIIINNGDTSIINVANYAPDRELTSDNIVEAITEALEVSKYIFIPEGHYIFNMTLEHDAVIFCDRNTHFETETEQPVFNVVGASFSLYGGNFTAGANDDTRNTIYTSGYHGAKGIIKLTDCHDCIISGVHSEWSKHGSVFTIENCANVIFENLELVNFLMCGIRINHYNKNIAVRNCTFRDIKEIAGYDYCYAVGTGAITLDREFTPPDGIIYENNYIYNSEDCGLDTHGATNVIIRNNKIIETICAITAYNDDARIKRPEGWHMNNVIIENNYCESTKDNEPGRSFPHPFVMVGSFNNHGSNEPGYENNPGSFYSFNNCVIRNNYFKTVNSIITGVITPADICRNLVIDNNIIDCCGISRPIYFLHAINFRFTNNTVIDAGRNIGCEGSSGVIENNTLGSCVFDFVTTHPSYVKNCVGDLRQTRTPLLACGDHILTGNNLEFSKSLGLALRAGITPDTIEVTVSDGIATAPAANWLIPGVAITLDSINAYVADVIDMRHFKVITASGTAPADGSYTLTYRAATLVTLS